MRVETSPSNLTTSTSSGSITEMASQGTRQQTEKGRDAMGQGTVQDTAAHNRKHSNEEKPNLNRRAHTGLQMCADCPSDCNQPLTVFAKHLVRPEDAHKFEAWCRQIAKISTAYEGFLGSEMIRPMSLDDDEYVSIFRYDTYEHLQTWMDSDDRRLMVEKTKEFADRPIQLSYHSLEYWFVPSAASPSSPIESEAAAAPDGPPPKYKMVAVTTGIVYSQLFWIPDVVTSIAPNLHWALAMLISTFSLVVLASYVLFPVVTRVLAFWLFPNADYGSKLRELIPSWLTKDKADEQSGAEDSNGHTPAHASKTNSIINVTGDSARNELPV